ncbi:SWIM zinc finger family protein [Helicobacter sp. TUL]
MKQCSCRWFKFPCAHCAR